MGFKYSYALVLGSLFCLNAMADGLPSLKDNMSAIGKAVKAITLAVNDKTQNSASAAQAKKLEQLFTAVLSQEPDKIAQMPADQQAPALAQYKTLIQQEITDSQRLQTAFATNDNASAAAILQDMLIKPLATINLNRHRGEDNHAKGNGTQKMGETARPVGLFLSIPVGPFSPLRGVRFPR